MSRSQPPYNVFIPPPSKKVMFSPRQQGKSLGYRLAPTPENEELEYQMMLQREKVQRLREIEVALQQAAKEWKKDHG